MLLSFKCRKDLTNPRLLPASLWAVLCSSALRELGLRWSVLALTHLDFEATM